MSGTNETVLFCKRRLTISKLAEDIAVGCNVFGYLAVCAEKPLGATNNDFQERLQVHLREDVQPFWHVHGGPRQKYAMQARTFTGMSLFVEKLSTWPHQYRLTYRGLLLCNLMFGTHHQIFHVDPEQCLIVATHLDLTNED